MVALPLLDWRRAAYRAWRPGQEAVCSPWPGSGIIVSEPRFPSTARSIRSLRIPITPDFQALRAPALRKRLRRGLIAIVALTVFMLIMGTLGWSIIGMLAGVALGILLGGWAAGVDRNPPLIVGFIGMPAFALVMLIEIDVATIGFDRGTIALNDLGRGFLATTVRFKDAHVATNYVGLAEATSRGGSVIGVWRVAPIVASDWTPQKPVLAWAVAYSSVYRPPGGPYGSRQWREDHRGGVFFKASVFDELSDAVDGAVQQYGLNAAEHAPLLYWVADPDAALAENRLLALEMALAAYGIWAVVVLGDAVIRRRRATKA